MKNIIFIAFMTCVSITLTAQMYFDGGIGVGGAWTINDGTNVTDAIDVDTNLGVTLDLKAGYDISGIKRIYLTAEISGVGHRLQRIEGTDYYIQYNSYLLGPGVIVYPHPNFQVSAAIGYSFTANSTDLPFIIMADGNGFALNFSGAYDVGRDVNSVLIGVKFHYANNALDHPIVKRQETSFLGVYVRYRFKG